MLTPRHVVLLIALPVLASTATVANGQAEERDSLWAAVRNGDAKKAKELIDKGTNVNAKNEMGVTALWIAATKRKLDVIEVLLSAGADVNARDLIWYQTPLSQAVGEGQAEMTAALIRAGAKDIDAAVILAASSGKLAVIRAILDNAKPAQEALDGAMFAAPKNNKDIRSALEKAGAKAVGQASQNDKDSWKTLAGTYESENGGKLTIDVLDSGLAIRRGAAHQSLKPIGADAFSPLGLPAAAYTFQRKGEGEAEGEGVYRVVLKQYTAEISYYRLTSRPVAKVIKPARDDAAAKAAPVLNWPALRGLDGTGIADGQHPPLAWNVQDGTNIQWKTDIPGLGHSSPIVWGDRIFLTTAISGKPNPKVRIGNYGDVKSVNDTTKHTWQVLCLDREDGKILWTRTAFEGVPKIKRHEKGSQANCTAATDGKHVVACFGSEGLYCYDFEGKQLWKRDLSFLDSSFAIEQEYEWGFGSSPIIHEGLVILQCDLSKDSFVAAYSLEDGSRVWSTPRDEIPSWSSPVIWRNAKRTELVTNASQYARGYDPATGKELWRLEKKSEVAIPMPVVGPEMIYISSGNRPIQPIFAIRAGAVGDISLEAGEDHNPHIAWSKMRGGPYMTTPICYRDYLYICSNAGVLTCYQAATGKEVYKERLGGVSYTASPLAADGRLYFTSEQGSVAVVKAGPDFEVLAVNEIDNVCMATPAISGGALFFRSQHHLFAIRKKEAENRQLVPHVLGYSATNKDLPVLQGKAEQDTPPVVPAISDRLHKYIDAKEIAGAVTLVATPDRVIHLGATGNASQSPVEAMLTDAIFWIASMSKPILGTLMLILQDEGLISVDDPVEKYLPEFKELKTADGKPAKVTIRHLLTHTSGMGEITGAQARDCKTLAAVIPLYVAKPVAFTPGSKWVYCQSGINTAGRIAEVVTGEPLEKLLQRRLFGPLGMKDTTFYLTQKQLPRLAKSYRRTNKGDLEVADIGFLNGKSPTSVDRFPAPNGGLFSTASDYARFCQMILRGGELDGKRYLKPETVKLMTTIQTAGLKTGFTDGNGWGLAWCVVREPQGVTGMLSPGTFGHGGAYGTQAWIDPETKRIYILMVQRANFPNSDASEVRKGFQEAASGVFSKLKGK